MARCASEPDGRGDASRGARGSGDTNFFALLGTPALLGRTFTIGVDLSRVEPEVVLSHGFWQRHMEAIRASSANRSHWMGRPSRSSE